ncbi:transmembrane channel-like protein 7 [Physella acuta]|uniref:transmembrane channel-like protein 7 n=1 Tax=Physella acuta TaxID=109671 RepID=UPI0027DCB92A|nr:transmembrane channel-like protein 7 [Physella acuta]
MSRHRFKDRADEYDQRLPRSSFVDTGVARGREYDEYRLPSSETYIDPVTNEDPPADYGFDPPADYDEAPPADYNVGGGDVGVRHNGVGDQYDGKHRSRFEPTTSDYTEVNLELQGLDGNNSLRRTWKHRRHQSDRMNGFGYYKTLRRRVNENFDPGDDDSVESLNYMDLRDARRFLATIRIKKKDTSSKEEILFADDAAGPAADDEHEEVGMPSTRQKMRGLTERLSRARQEKTTRRIANSFRGAIESTEAQSGIYYPLTLVKGVKVANSSLSNVWDKLNFWAKQMRQIEGHFGIAVSTYFRFTRWLVNINFLVFFLYLCFIYIPQLAYSKDKDYYTPLATNDTRGYLQNTMVKCSKSYQQRSQNATEKQSEAMKFLDVAQGTGILENTMLFYGYYTSAVFLKPTQDNSMFEADYRMDLAYLLTVGISFVLMFLIIVKNSSSTIKETVMDFNNSAFPLYTNAVFGCWDYCINSKAMASYKKKIIFDDFKAQLAEVERKRQLEKKSTKEMSQLYLKRAGINILVIALLAGSFYAIYVSTDYLLKQNTDELTDIQYLALSYLPSIVISILNAVIPEFFLILCSVEQYSNSVATKITIIRAVFLRLASIWVLIVSLYYRLQYRGTTPYDCPEEMKQNVTRCCGNTLWDPAAVKNNNNNVQCWESYVGQQFYKLCIVDFLSVILLVLLLQVPRRFIYYHFHERYWIINKVGKAKFDLPLQVLDLVYTQSVCWMGMFFTPLLPALTFVKIFFFFFLKKFELLFVTEAPQIAYKASRSYSFFQTVLLLSFITISCLLGYMIGNLQPSMSCGPFRQYTHENFVMFHVVTDEVNSWPDIPKAIFQFFGTASFFIPAFLITLLACYYYWSISSGYMKMEELLRNQVKLEAHDKQFLLARVDDAIKKGELETASF